MGKWKTFQIESICFSRRFLGKGHLKDLDGWYLEPQISSPQNNNKKHIKNQFTNTADMKKIPV